MQAKFSKSFSVIILIFALLAFVYGVSKAIKTVQKTQISTYSGIYTNCVNTSQIIKEKSLYITKSCQSSLCRVQKILDYVTNIPYKINNFKSHSPQKTIQNNFGDCDDKSNLLISMLHAVGIDAYFVLVPKHIFVIVSLSDKELSNVKGIWINEKKYFILESTAKDSTIGFPLHYKLSDIEAIVEPFGNQKIKYAKLFYKL